MPQLVNDKMEQDAVNAFDQPHVVGWDVHVNVHHGAQLAAAKPGHTQRSHAELFGVLDRAAAQLREVALGGREPDLDHPHRGHLGDGRADREVGARGDQPAAHHAAFMGLRDMARLPAVLEALRGQDPVILDANAPDLALAPELPEVLGVRSMLIIPLVSGGRLMGTLGVHSPGTPHVFTAKEIALARGIAAHAAVAIDNNRIYAERRAVATELQRSLLPPQLPRIEGIDLGAEYVPAGEAVDVGGDFYDIVSLPDGRWLVVIGDVSGKGVQAAIVTGLVRDVTRALVRDGRPVAETLARLNETLVERGGGRSGELLSVRGNFRFERQPPGAGIHGSGRNPGATVPRATFITGGC